MFKMQVALIERTEGGALEVFPGVDSLNLSPFHIVGADPRSLEEWKRSILHYAAMEQFHGVYFFYNTEKCYLRGESFPADVFPGDANFAIFPVQEGEINGPQEEE